MKNKSITYRLLTVFTVFAVFFSISSPASGIAELCDMMTDSQTSAMAHCDLPESDITNHPSDNMQQSESDTNCHITTICPCSQDLTTAQAIPSLAKTSISYIPVLTEILSTTPNQPVTFTDNKKITDLHAPPLYLKHSSFLN